MFIKKRILKNQFTTPENDVTLHKNLKFTALEQYKLLRANLKFTIPAGTKCPIIGVTSPSQNEGKSTTAINLSYVLAEEGKKVLLVDADLRLPTIGAKMGIAREHGFADLLVSDNINISIEDLKTDINDNLYVLTAGTLPPNPSELLGSERVGEIVVKLSNEFDCIIVDLPPVGLVSDSIVVSKHFTGFVLIVRENYTEKKNFKECYRQMKLSGVKVLGVVINDSKSFALKGKTKR